jgi:hypothetical protein
MNDLDPRTIFERLLRFWWAISLGMILGGVAGWVFSRIHQPIYEATAYYQVTMDEKALVNRLGLDPQTDVDFLLVNPYLTPAADLFYSTDIREPVIASLEAEGIHLLPADFNTRNFILDRRGSVWFVTARSSDPDRAVKMADIWLQTTDGLLREFQAHAVQLQVLKLQNSLVERCFTDFSFSEANQCAGTTFASLPEMNVFLGVLQEQIAVEDAGSRGIDPLLSFVIDRPAVATASPMLYARSNLMVAGGLVGLLIAVVFLYTIKRSVFVRK